MIEVNLAPLLVGWLYCYLYFDVLDEKEGLLGASSSPNGIERELNRTENILWF